MKPGTFLHACINFFMCVYANYFLKIVFLGKKFWKRGYWVHTMHTLCGEIPSRCPISPKIAARPNSLAYSSRALLYWAYTSPVSLVPCSPECSACWSHWLYFFYWRHQAISQLCPSPVTPYVFIFICLFHMSHKHTHTDTHTHTLTFYCEQTSFCSWSSSYTLPIRGSLSLEFPSAWLHSPPLCFHSNFYLLLSSHLSHSAMRFIVFTYLFSCLDYVILKAEWICLWILLHIMVTGT